VKRQFGYRKVRYRGIAKNGAPQVFSLLALANLCISPAGHLWLAALTRKSSLKPQTIASPR
jgi:hypothetical protein